MRKLKSMLIILFVLIAIVAITKDSHAALGKGKPWYDFFPPISGQPDEVRGVDPIKLRKTVRMWTEKHISTELRAGSAQKRWKGIITRYHLADEIFADMTNNFEDNSIAMTKVDGLTTQITQLQNDITTLEETVGEGGGGTGGGTPGGSDSQVQYNNGGNFGGDSDLTWDDTSDTLAVTGNVDLTGANTMIDNGLYSEMPATCTPGQLYVVNDGHSVLIDCTGIESLVYLYVCIDLEEGGSDWQPVVERDDDSCG